MEEAACARSLDALATSCPRCANTVQQNLWLQEGVTNMERMALIVIGGWGGGRWGCVLQTVWAVGRAGGRQGLLRPAAAADTIVHDKTGRAVPFQTNLKMVHSGSYQQNAVMTVTCTDSRTLGLSLSPKENKH